MVGTVCKTSRYCFRTNSNCYSANLNVYKVVGFDDVKFIRDLIIEHLFLDTTHSQQ